MELAIEPPVKYTANFLGEDVSSIYTKMSVLPWDRHSANMYGKKIDMPRFFVWMGIPPLKLYGAPVPTIEWTPEAIDVRERVQKATGVLYDSLNINMYRDENDYLGWHIDPEDEGRWDYPIASVTLGAERQFQMRQYIKNEGSSKKVPVGDIHSITLGHGSLLLMPPGFQAGWLHRAPKSNKKCIRRINLTFRRMAP